MVLVTVNGNILDYCPTENPFILNSDQSDDPNTNFSVLPIFRFWVFQSIQFSGRISKSPKFVLVRTLIFSWWVIEANKIRMKKGMILCVHMVPCRSCGFPENKSRIETESVEIESRINFLLRWFFVWTFFSFQNRLFPEFLFSRISASVPFFANSKFFAEFANLVRFLRRSAKPVLDPEEIISDMTRIQWFIPDSHMSSKKSHDKKRHVTWLFPFKKC